MVGIVQEQHADRARLFMQWKEMDFPILVDSYDRYEVPYVPLTLLIDEHGVVRHQVPFGEEPGETLRAFVDTEYETPAKLAEVRSTPETTSGLQELVTALQREAEASPDDGYALFRYGVALRKRYDSPNPRPGDFQAAVDAWTAALRIDPNNYIWRRRIQQYGPRLDKPYPFYDWVVQARQDIVARGETPVPLVVEPAGSELADRSETLEPAAGGEIEPPDPTGRVTRDDRYVELEVAAVPSLVMAGEPTRVHLTLQPRTGNRAHWNNEAGPTKVWLDLPRGWSAGGPLRTIEVPRSRSSKELRRAEFELRSPESARGRVDIPGHAVYYVCEDVAGTCLYRRQDFTVTISLAAPG